MSRYHQVFTSLKAAGRIAFIPFAVAGDPDRRLSEAVLKTYVDAGADILEIGYPFSDPIADGPVNQRAGQRAIASGLNHARFFSLVKNVRMYTDVPIGVLLYANSLHHLGFETFCRRAADSGIDSLLVADMPPEESRILSASMRTAGLQRAHIVSELTPAERIRTICSDIEAFVYVVSRLGPTGVQNDISSTVAATLATLRKHTTRPLCVGFGLSRPEHVSSVKALGADGAIVGSALVKLIEHYGNAPNTMLKKLTKMIRNFKRAT
ncbi:MAG: tryptophan synthase subunit alpha [Chitinivibrionales bacterium]|nr:tryptophan synthase subunit alpha [Chitinivibrionales bacterium]